MVPNKLDKKYHVPILLGLFFATLVCNFYDFYTTCATLAQYASQLTRLNITISVIQMLFADIIVPSLLCMLFAFIVYQFGFTRYVRCISRSDFIYFVMLFISGSRLLMGFVNIFALLNVNVSYCTTGFLSTLFNGAAMLIMFFVVFKRVYKFNPAEEYNAFRAWATWFMIGGGIEAVIGNGAVLILMDTPELLTEYFGIDITANISLLTAGCATGIVIYFAYLIAIIVLGEILKKKARLYLDPATRGDYYDAHTSAPYTVRTDAADVFGETKTDGSATDGDDKVFDEFDI